MKKYLLIIALLAVVVFASGCTQSNQTNQTTSTYSVAGLSFNYPIDWLISSQTLGDNSIISLRDPEFQKSNGTSGDSVDIIKQPSRANLTYENVKNEFLNQTNQSFNTTSGNVNIAGVNANLTTFNGKDANGTNTEIKLIFFQKNNITYVLSFVAGGGVNIQNQQQYFDIIIKSFQTG